MSGDSTRTRSDAEAQFRRTLSPALFPSWQATCHAFGKAISAGPGLVILVGGPGSGKTSTLLAYAEGAGKKARVRQADDPVRPSAEIDIVDDVQAGSLPRLTPFAGTRAVAVEAELAERLVRAFPKARVVPVRPMQPRDTPMMIELRRTQLGLPAGYFTSEVLARLDELCAGNPRRLDELLFRSLRLTESAAVARVSPALVEQAALQLLMAGSDAPDAPVGRATGSSSLGRSEGSGQPWRRQGAEAPSFWAGAAAVASSVQRTSDQLVRPAAKPGRGPQPVGRLTLLVAAIRSLGGARDEPYHARTPADGGRAGSRWLRIGREASRAAAAAVVALAVTAYERPSWLPWNADSRQDLAQSDPADMIGGLPMVLLPPRMDAIPTALVEPAPPTSPTLVPPALGSADAAAPSTAAAQAVAVPEPAPEPAPPAWQMAAVPEAPSTGLPAITGPNPVSAALVDDGPVQEAQAAAATPTPALAAVPAPDRGPPTQIAMASDSPAAIAAPGPTGTAAPSAAPTAANGKEAARLLALGKALLAINQVADARELIKASAEMGDSRAAALLAAYDTTASGRHGRTGVIRSERAGARVKPAARVSP